MKYFAVITFFFNVEQRLMQFYFLIYLSICKFLNIIFFRFLAIIILRNS